MGEAVIADADKSSYAVDDYKDSLFRQKPVDNRFKKIEYQEFHPINTLQGASKITFVLPKWLSPTIYQLWNGWMTVTIRLRTGVDGTKNPQPGASLGLINQPLWSMFSACRLWIGEVAVNPNPDLYGYRAYFEHLTTYSDEVKKGGFLTAGGFAKDTAGNFNETNNYNSGWMERLKGYVDASTMKPKENQTVTPTYSDPCVFTYCGRLGLDTDEFMSSQILNGLALKIEYTLQNKDFLFLGESTALNNAVDFTIENMVLRIPCAHLQEPLYRDIERHLEKKPNILSFMRKEAIGFTIPSNTSIYSSETLYPGEMLPARCVVGFVPTSAFLGKIDENPYEFTLLFGGKSFLKLIHMTLNGTSVDGIEENGDATVLYTRFLTMANMMNSTYCNGISLTDFVGGNAFIPFDFSTSLASSSPLVTPTMRVGHARIKLQFTVPTTREMTMILFNQYNSVLHVDKDRRVKARYIL